MVLYPPPPPTPPQVTYSNPLPTRYSNPSPNPEFVLFPGGFGHGGGGGGGAVLTTFDKALLRGSYEIVIGSGAPGLISNPSAVSPGGNTTAFSVTATGGGCGGSEDGSPKAGGNGANSGGGVHSQTAGIPNAPKVPIGWVAYAGNLGAAGGANLNRYPCGGGTTKKNKNQLKIKITTKIIQAVVRGARLPPLVVAQAEREGRRVDLAS